jgi:hypothetical protein
MKVSPTPKTTAAAAVEVLANKQVVTFGLRLQLCASTCAQVASKAVPLFQREKTSSSARLHHQRPSDQEPIDLERQDRERFCGSLARPPDANAAI